MAGKSAKCPGTGKCATALLARFGIDGRQENTSGVLNEGAWTPYGSLASIYRPMVCRGGHTQRKEGGTSVSSCLSFNLTTVWLVETDHPSRPYQLHGPSRSGPSYMLQLILWTDWTVMDCQILPYTLSLYGHMLIIAIIVLIHLMSIVLNFYCSLLLHPIVVWSDLL